MMRRFTTVALFYLVGVLIACAQNYYVDSKAGKDSNDGLSPSTAWQTLAKANSPSVKSGSKVLLRRGCEWRGQIVVPADNVTYSAYGEGAKPVINASRIISGWTRHSGSIYKATVPFEVKAVYCDGKYQELAHWPDNDWLTVSEASISNDYIVDDDSKVPDDVVGAGILVKTREWYLQISTVTSRIGNRVNYVVGAKYEAQKNSVYYFNNKLWMLDSPGEWFYDQSNQTLYVWIDTGDSPLNHIIEVPELKYGIFVNARTNITIENLSVVYSKEHGILTSNTENVTLRGLDVSKARVNGIIASGKSINVTVENCGIALSGANGIHMSGYGTNCIIRDNIISDIGMAGRLPDIYGQGGITISKGNNDIQVIRNRISRINRNGVSAWSSKVEIRNNVIDQVMLRQSDGGGIYVHGADMAGSQVVHNIITNVIGDPLPDKPARGLGIYMDDWSKGVTVVGNTISNVYNAIKIHNSADNVVTGNVTHDSKAAALDIIEDPIVDISGYTQNNVISGNVFTIDYPIQLMAHIKGHLGHINFGKYDRNHYLNSSGEFLGAIFSKSPDIDVKCDLVKWRQMTGQDSNSIDVGAYYRFEPFQVLSLGTNLITNATFDLNISRWGRWSPSGATTISWSSEGGLDGGCLKTVNTDPNGADGQTISNGLALEKGVTYCLSVDMAAPVTTTVQMVARLNGSPYEVYGSRYFSVGPMR